MTTTTVEVERTVTESEKMNVCDECQREIDENGREFVSVGGSGWDKSVNNGPTLHFCSECLSDMTEGAVNPAYVEQTEKWLAGNWSSEINVFSVEKSVVGVKNVSIIASGVGLFVLAGLAIASSMWTVPVSIVYAFGVGLLIMQLVITSFARDAMKAVESANESLK